MHDQKRVGIVQNDIINGIACTVFAHRTVHDAHRRSAPVLRIETGFRAESLDDGFYYRSLERALNDDFASLLFSSFNEFRALTRSLRGEQKPGNPQYDCARSHFSLHMINRPNQNPV